MKLDHIVRVFVGGAVDVPEIGLVDGVCEWRTNDNLGILSDKWCGSITDTVDISMGGKYATYTDTSITLQRSKIVLTTLKNNGLSITGKRVEILETDGVTENIVRRGVARTPVNSGNATTITVSHIANYYKVAMTSRIGDEYLPIVVGSSVDGVKMGFVEYGSDKEVTIGSQKVLPYFECLSIQNYVSVEMLSKFDEDIVSEQDLQDFMDSSEFFKANGANSQILTPMPKPNVFIYDKGGVNYWMGFFKVVPLNRYDTTDDWEIPVGETVVIEPTGYNIYTKPDGVTGIGIANLTTGEDDTPMPHYVDSITDDGNSIKILDADSKGDLVIKPLNKSDFGVTVPYADINANTEVTIRADKYYGEGVFVDGRVGGVFVDSIIPLNKDDIDKVANNTSGGSVKVNLTVDNTLGWSYAWIGTSTNTTFNPKESNGEEIYLNLATSLKIGPSSLALTKNHNVKVFLTTPKQTYYVWNKSVPYGGTDYNLVQNNIPLTPALDSPNAYYRVDSPTGDNWYSIPLDMSTKDDYELELPWTITVIVETYLGFTDDSLQYFVETHNKVHLVTQQEFDASDVRASGIGGVKDSSGSTITDLNAFYQSCLEKQNYSTYGISQPSAGWGLDYVPDDLSGVIDYLSLTLPYYGLSLTSTDTETATVKNELLRYGCGIGYVSNSGLESCALVSDMYVQGGKAFDLHTIKPKSLRITEYNNNRVYTEISVKYKGGSISITNTEQSVYDESYVSGVSNADDARNLWECGRLLYIEYGVKNRYPSNASKIEWIISEADAVSHVFDQYMIQGAIVNGGGASLYRRYKASFVTATSESYGEDFGIGSKIELSAPYVGTSHTGIVTSYSNNPVGGEAQVTAEMVGDFTGNLEDILINETGTQTDDIIETGTQTTNYVEGV